MKHFLWLTLLFSGAAMAAPAPNCTAGDLTFTGTGSSADYDACKNSDIPIGSTSLGSAFQDSGNPIYVGFHLRGCTSAVEYSATGLPAGVTLGDYGQLLGNASAAGSGTATITCDPPNAAPGDQTWDWTVTGGSFAYASLGLFGYGTNSNFGGNGATCDAANQAEVRSCITGAGATPTEIRLTSTTEYVFTSDLNISENELTFLPASGVSGQVRWRFDSGAEIALLHSSGADDILFHGFRISASDANYWPGNTVVDTFNDALIYVAGTNDGTGTDNGDANIVFDRMTIDGAGDAGIDVSDGVCGLSVTRSTIFQNYKPLSWSDPLTPYGDRRCRLTLAASLIYNQAERGPQWRGNISGEMVSNIHAGWGDNTFTGGFGYGTRFIDRGGVPSATNQLFNDYLDYNPAATATNAGADSAIVYVNTPTTAVYSEGNTVPVGESDLGTAATEFVREDSTTPPPRYTTAQKLTNLLPSATNPSIGAFFPSTAEENVYLDVIAQMSGGAPATEPGALYAYPDHPGTEAIVTNGLTCASANVECPTSVATALTAIANADPGDYILLRGAAGGGPAGGVYVAGTQGGTTDGATLSISGTSGNPIYLSNYPGEFVEWYGGESEASWQDYDANNKPYGGDQDGFQIDGNYWHIQGLKINGWARFGIRVSGDYNVIAGNWLNRTWLTSIFVMGASDTDTIGTQVIGNYTSYSYHGSGVSIGATHSLTNPWTADNTLFAQNICYRHGYQEDGNHSAGIGGDGGAGSGPGAGGENSDCTVISKGCFGGNGSSDDWRCGDITVYRTMSLEMGDDHFDLGNEGAKAYGNMGIGKVEKGGKGIKTLSSFSKAHQFVGNGFWGDLTASGLDDGVEHRQLVTGNSLGNYFSVNNGVFGASIRGGFYVPGPGDTPTIRNELFRNNAADFGETANWDIPDRSNALWFSTDPDPLHAGNCEGLTMTDMDLTTLDDFLTQQDNSSYLDLYTDLAGPCALTGASPAVDAGTFIPGVHCPVADDTGSNPDVSCRRWCGTAPDYGPFEYCP